LKKQSDSKVELKSRIELARDYLQAIGHPVSQTQGYELAARLLGFQNKHALCAAIPTVELERMFLVPSVASPAVLSPAVAGPLVAKPFDLYIEAFSTGHDSTRWLRVHVDQSFVDAILAQQQVCLKKKLESTATSESWGQEWDCGEELRIQGDTLVVTDEDFWFHAYPKHSNDAVETHAMTISALLAALDPKNNAGTAGWADGILFAAASGSASDNQDFARELLEDGVIDINESCIDQMAD
jgi:hypothetical protein